MGVIESVKKGFSVAAKSMSMVGILFVFGLAWNLVNIFLFPSPQATTPPSTSQTVMIVAAWLVFILLTIFMQAGSMGYVRDLVKQGEATITSLKESGAKYYLKFLTITFFTLLIVIAMMFPIILAALINSRSQAIMAISVVGTFLLAFIGMYFILLMFFAYYMVVVDGKEPIDAIKASIKTISNGKLLRTFGLYFLMVALLFAAPLLIATLFASPSIVGVALYGMTVWIAIFVFNLALLLIYQLNEKFRASWLGQSELLRIYLIFMILAMAGFCMGFPVGALYVLAKTAINGVGAQVIFAFLTSLVNAFLGVWVTGTFMNYYLAISNPNNNR